MPQQPLDYLTPARDRRPIFNSTACGSAVATAIVVLVVNGALYAWAYAERGWGTILIFGLSIPANLVMLIAALAVTPTVRRASRGGRVGIYMLVAVLVPLLSVVAFGWALSAVPPDPHAAP